MAEKLGRYIGVAVGFIMSSWKFIFAVWVIILLTAIENNTRHIHRNTNGISITNGILSDISRSADYIESSTSSIDNKTDY